MSGGDVRLCHDVSWSAAIALADTIRWEREEDRLEAVHEFYLAVRAALDQYRTLKEEEARKLRGAGPSDN